MSDQIITDLLNAEIVKIAQIDSSKVAFDLSLPVDSNTQFPGTRFLGVGIVISVGGERIHSQERRKFYALK